MSQGWLRFGQSPPDNAAILKAFIDIVLAVESWNVGMRSHVSLLCMVSPRTSASIGKLPPSSAFTYMLPFSASFAPLSSMTTPRVDLPGQNGIRHQLVGPLKIRIRSKRQL
ncbi:uncharacterized protein PADG_11168 [Paracoccidioides brasiliensis Pb18]|uniref:Uncharacterized protein n=2 Tax=Paracoccidioides brasiliensis TaxID=121759 RepID=A0A0A0HZG1_PARBD|nr:uncharacterized protein PADG_11168 [Paracoccidioides brasiliensis Pb18]KGM92710.1 hypothetical protein PADG_11168 [Paracoccidioides brasiliensis Pb18]ODH28500.1 hypothetical protein ACO22_03929 [Paracoccidioides brasiliensis]ODH49418.1 hypothetical protein GX48_04503 [Paracoccidioides brasiliensis]